MIAIHALDMYGGGFEIDYWDDREQIDFIDCDKKALDKSYQLCKRFLEGHIEWAKLDCWGEALKS